MFNIGALELLVILVIGLLLIGPERLPEVLRTIVTGIERLRKYSEQIYLEIKQSSGINELQQDLHNKEVLHSIAIKQKHNAKKSTDKD